jgi:Coenzyme PQQ synthesis protein D (PqqD)
MTEHIPIRAPGLKVDERPDGLVVHQPAHQRVHHLNSTATLVFELCSGEATVNRIASAVQTGFDLETLPIAEVTQCVEQLVDQQIVRLVEPRPRDGSEPIRVLAFTASRDRPYFLRHCILQMRSQSYTVDHAVYVNGADNPGELYDDLLGENVFLRFGPSMYQHDNHVRAIETAPYERYDLFCKIDDDDVYRLNYIEEIVADFSRDQWDYSATHSDGRINGSRWLADQRLNGFGLSDIDRSLGIKEAMPPTVVFSRRGIECVRQLGPISPETEWNMQGNWDAIWIRTLARLGLRQSVRAQSNFIYHIHGANLTTGSWLIAE